MLLAASVIWPPKVFVPVLTSARSDGATQLVLAGTLNSTANTQFRIEFFANSTQDSTGYGEGQTYLGFANVTTDAQALAKVAVTGEVLEHTKGPKIRIHKFKNKTGYHKRQGHRQKLTVLKVTGIN